MKEALHNWQGLLLGAKQVILNTKMLCIWENNTLLADSCGLILYSRLKEVTLRQTQQIIEVWRI